MGYLASEYLEHMKATEKTDVFGFGVVSLEVATGKRPIDREHPQSHDIINLVDWVCGLHTKDQLMDAIDPRLTGECDRGEAMRLFLVGLICANPDCTESPSMRRVLRIMNCKAEVLIVRAQGEAVPHFFLWPPSECA
ncbi:putative L-type lectin-domain containing receptor kinase S.7 [Acorus calamus]|uniref:L-type lectin-domain containing receptor kinase S.7 n=1 Tax=Acorus calamus TaxID=4465 RepID=A0AAV9C672_ACOCL|nr:putative L-type lectin-domain containing receptor kinase S.7 [Acorus calamus]